MLWQQRIYSPSIKYFERAVVCEKKLLKSVYAICFQADYTSRSLKEQTNVMSKISYECRKHFLCVCEVNCGKQSLVV